MPIIGILASAITGNLITGAYESIATVTVGSGGSATITFSSIPATYTHLQIRAIAKITGGSAGFSSSFLMNFNSDTAANYNGHILFGTGSSQGSTVPTGVNPVSAIWMETGSAEMAAHIIDILDYANVNKYKTIKALVGSDTNGAGVIELVSGAWRSTSAISSIVLSNGTNYAQYSSFALYGIKGA